MESDIQGRTRTQRPVREAVFDLAGGWPLLPVIAALGGAWAFGPTLFNIPSAVLPEGAATARLTEVAVVVALIVGGWLPLWQALVHTDWQAALSRWRTWKHVEPLPHWPYVQPGTPGAALHHRLSQARAWWYEVGKPSLQRSLGLALLGTLVSLLLSLVLGRLAILLSVTFVTCAELAALWHEGRGDVGAAWLGIAMTGLPWLLGATWQRDDIPGAAGRSALVLMLLVGFYAGRSWSALLGPAVGAAFLVWQGNPMAAGWLLLLALPGLVALVHEPSRREYRRITGPWTLLMVALIALVV